MAKIFLKVVDRHRSYLKSQIEQSGHKVVDSIDVADVCFVTFETNKLAVRAIPVNLRFKFIVEGLTHSERLTRKLLDDAGLWGFLDVWDIFPPLNPASFNFSERLDIALHRLQPM
ncbi:MAG TPA: hypothetical protein VLI92_01680 [Candidatus Saccharimonadales bacterium]|nr:hypothetical protein [Candidatus Saccharimonadales bacterium]